MAISKKNKRQYKWYSALESLTPYIFKISTPNGVGTGFQIFHSASKPLCAIATAHHVLAHENEWEEPIKIIHYQSKSPKLLKVESRAIFNWPTQDLAIILFNKGDLPVQINAPKLVQSGITLRAGVEIGWCGFPSIAPQDLCFFSGYISCYLKENESYLVDGVAINGVSGGPAFYIPADSDEFIIAGVISAYLPNRVAGQTLPGVAFVSTVESYQLMLKKLKSLDDAKDQAKEQEKQIGIEKKIKK